MVGIKRPALLVGTVNDTLAELLRCPDLVACCAETADVAIVISATARKWHDVIRHRRRRENAVRVAITTERFGSKAPSSLGYATATTKATGLRLSIVTATSAGPRHQNCVGIRFS